MHCFSKQKTKNNFLLKGINLYIMKTLFHFLTKHKFITFGLNTSNLKICIHCITYTCIEHQLTMNQYVPKGNLGCTFSAVKV